MKIKFYNSLFLVPMFVFSFAIVDSCHAVLLVFELKKSDILFVGDNKVEGGKKRSVEIDPGTYRIKLITNSKKPVHLPGDDTLYYPENGRVVIKDQIKISEDADGQIINLTTTSDDTP